MKASEILGFDDLKTKVVKVKHWDCELTVRELGLDQGIQLFSMVSDLEGKPTIDAEQIAKVVAWGVVDPTTNERIWSDEDVPALMKKSRLPIMFLYGEITNISVDDAEKN